MVKKIMRSRDAIFVVTEEKSCPLYNRGDEFKVEKFCLTVPTHKPDCLCLAQQIAKIVTSKDSFVGISAVDAQRSRYDCGGCDGIIRFEFKKEKDFTTRQMKLLSETEERSQRQHLDKFFGGLRKMDLFEPLDDDTLSDLTLLLDVWTIPADKVVIRKGDPASNLYIVLFGRVAVLADDGSKVAEMGEGEIFGEMSLLSGEPASGTIHTVEATRVAMLSLKNFRHVLKKYPILQLFLFKLLVRRAQVLALRSGIITSGMNGDLTEISTANLFRRINATRKSGTVDLRLEQGKALVFFRQGEIVHARYLNFRGKSAVLALLGQRSGNFTFSKQFPKELDDAPAIGNVGEIIAEGMQAIKARLG